MRVLIAEDDPIVAHALAARVRELGDEPLGPYADGASALAAASAGDADLYLLDIGLPGLDGLELAARLREHGLRRPAVVVTGSADDALVARAAEAGVDAYLLKPIDGPELAAAMQLAVARHGELAAAEQRADSAETALAERKTVERARDLLAESLDVPAAEAYRRLQRTARDQNRRLVEVAAAVLEQEGLLRKRP